MNKNLTLTFTPERVDQIINLLNFAIKCGGYDTALVATPIITEIVQQAKAAAAKTADQTAE